MIDIEKIKKDIVTALMPINPEKIILFGSYAYGNPTEDSDLDICVVEKDYANKWEEKAEIRKLLTDIRISKDIILEKLSFFENHISEDWINSVWYDANKYGKLLYEKR